MRRLPADRWRRIGLALAIALLSGVMGAAVLPRFVSTVGEMFGLMFGALLVGVAVGVVLRSR